jgi:hypothetical protein
MSLQDATIEREVEFVASESSREALIQAATLLTTVHAHLVYSTQALAQYARSNTSISHVLRGLEEAKKTADAAINISETFFEVAYGNRDSSPALVDRGLRRAAGIATKNWQCGEPAPMVDLIPIDDCMPIRGISALDFLVTTIPAITAAMKVAGTGKTVRIEGSVIGKLESMLTDASSRQWLWHTTGPATRRPGFRIQITAPAASLSRTEAESWLNGDNEAMAAITLRGLTSRLQKCGGILGLALAAQNSRFRIVLGFPV